MNRDQPGVAAGSGNELDGTVSGAVVQAARIHGNVTIGLPGHAGFRLPAPAQLPPVPANFTNRAAELTQLDAILAEHDPARRLMVAVINGGGEWGKRLSARPGCTG